MGPIGITLGMVPDEGARQGFTHRSADRHRGAGRRLSLLRRRIDPAAVPEKCRSAFRANGTFTDDLPSILACHGIVMPLQFVDIPPKDQGFEIRFVMADGEKRVVCSAQQGALDAIESGFMTSRSDRMARFVRNKRIFEAVASSLHDAGLPPHITRDHLSKLMASASRSAEGRS